MARLIFVLYSLSNFKAVHLLLWEICFQMWVKFNIRRWQLVARSTIPPPQELWRLVCLWAKNSNLLWLDFLSKDDPINPQGFLKVYFKCFSSPWALWLRTSSNSSSYICCALQSNPEVSFLWILCHIEVQGAVLHFLCTSVPVTMTIGAAHRRFLSGRPVMLRKRCVSCIKSLLDINVYVKIWFSGVSEQMRDVATLYKLCHS